MLQPRFKQEDSDCGFVNSLLVPCSRLIYPLGNKYRAKTFGVTALPTVRKMKLIAEPQKIA
jgi:hypothetical protein